MTTERSTSIGAPRTVVTGAAGFIGSTTVEHLLDAGHEVIGVDVLNRHYDPTLKRSHLAGLAERSDFTFVEGDLMTLDLEGLLADVDTVIHLAALAGVRTSWADDFQPYTQSNVSATQRLLHHSLHNDVQRVVYASSSSIYGNAKEYPVDESAVPAPHSPYGVTKLAGEHLCRLYARNFGLSTVSLRYFTVFGPKQRPDMAIHRLIQSALHQRPFPLYGDGTQVRDFTYVDDVVNANIAAATADVEPGLVVNIAGGGSISVTELIKLVEEETGRPVPLDPREPSAGDVQRTGGSTDRAERQLSWKPQISVAEGVARQVAWHRANAELLASLSDDEQ